MISGNDLCGSCDWNRGKLKRFKRVYKVAVFKTNDTQATFMFDGQEFVIGFAKYLIEFLEQKFK